MKINNFKLERFWAKYEFNTPYILCSSDCESFSIKEFTNSQGSPQLREEISKLYENIKPEEIIVFSGAEEGIFIFMKSEFLAILALRNKEKIIERNLGIIKNNLKLLDKFFTRYNNLFEWIKPKAGSIAFPKIKFNKNVEEFCLDLVNKKGVLLLPSTLYDYDNKHFRIGFGRKNMPEALNKLEEYISEVFT